MEDKLRTYFDEMVVYKDLKNSNFFSALSLPSFMRDWLLHRFQDDNGQFDMDELSEFIRRFIPKKEDWTAIKSRLVKDYEHVRLLAKISLSDSHPFQVTLSRPLEKEEVTHSISLEPAEVTPPSPLVPGC